MAHGGNEENNRLLEEQRQLLQRWTAEWLGDGAAAPLQNAEVAAAKAALRPHIPRDAIGRCALGKNLELANLHRKRYRAVSPWPPPTRLPASCLPAHLPVDIAITIARSCQPLFLPCPRAKRPAAK